MTPQTAARRFVATLLRHAFGDVLRMTERYPYTDIDHVAEARGAYARVEAAVRRQQKTPAVDPTELYNVVTGLVKQLPDDVQGPLHDAINALDDARVEELIVKQAAVYEIGIEVGRALKGWAA